MVAALLPILMSIPAAPPDADPTGGGRTIEQLADSSGIVDDHAALVQRMTSDGYLYLPGLLPEQDLARIRADLFAVLRDSWWLAEDAPRGRPRGR